jgi:hypothetical protein
VGWSTLSASIVSPFFETPRCFFEADNRDFTTCYGLSPHRITGDRATLTTWKDFLSAHMAVLAGTDFFTVEVLTWRGLATYYVLFFIHLESRRVNLAGVTRNPDAIWMERMARNAVDLDTGYLKNQRYVLHDRDTKYCFTFRSILGSGGVKCPALPARSPNVNAFAKRWIGSVKRGACAS